MSLREVDHQLYNEYRQEMNLEPFQEYFLRWYEKGGADFDIGPDNARLKKRLRDLRNSYDIHEIVSSQKEVRSTTIQSLISHERYQIAESTARNIYSQLRKL